MPTSNRNLFRPATRLSLLALFLAASALADPLDQWTRRHPFPNWAAVAFGGNQFVTVGESGAVRSSSDGVTWTARNAATANSLADVLYANGKFVAVGAAGTIRVSANGADWAAASSGVASSLAGIAYGGGTYVIVGSSGTVLTSTNATSWTQQSGISPTLALQSVTYGGNLFVAMTGVGELIQSPDGITWSAQPSQGGNPSRVTCVNNRFVIVDYGTKLSTNGIDWDYTNFVYPVLANIVYGAGYYVGVGNAVGSGNGGSILYSQNLTNWTTAVNDSTSYAFSGVAFGNGTFVAVGLHGLIRTSTDHLNWTVRSQTLTYLGNLYGVKYINKEFVAVGIGQVSPGGVGEDSPLLFSGAPGDNWYRRPSGTFSTSWALTYGQGLYVVVSSFGLRTSTNGINWVNAGSGLGGQTEAITYGANLFVVTSSNGGIASSSDGATFIARTSGTTRNLWGVAYGNGLFVAVGQGSTTGAFVTSPDGTNWTSHSSVNLRNIAFGNGTFVIVGDAGYLASGNGLSWTQRGSGTAGTINGVGYGDGFFIAVGDGGYLATSPDGTTWTPRNSGTALPLQRVAFGDRTFVVTGSSGTILESASTVPSLLSKPGVGGVELDLVGGFDRTYLLQSTTNLASPAWNPLTTLVSGQRQFTDPDVSAPKKFYRLTLP